MHLDSKNTGTPFLGWSRIPYLLAIAMLGGTCLLQPGSARGATPQPIRLFSSPRAAHRLSVATSEGSRVKVLDARLTLESAGARALAQAVDPIEVAIAMPGAAELVARIAPAPLLAPDLRITTTHGTNGQGQSELPVHPVILKGYVRDHLQSTVAFVVLDGRVFGLANDDDHLWFMQPAEPGNPASTDYLVRDLAIESGEGETTTCQADDLPQNKLVEESLRPNAVETVPDYGARLRFRLALDCDYPLVQNIFHGDTSAASAYVLLMAALASTIFERDVNVTFTVTYLNLWTVPSPYGTQQDPICTYLFNFLSYWNANRTSVVRDLAYLVSGGPTSSGGGCAFLSGLCSSGQGYAAVYCSGLFPGMPNNKSNHDLFNFTHELGHSLGSPHTHSCFWQTNSLLPPGALIDTCVTPSSSGDGFCYSGPTHIPAAKGTLMSYCGAAGPGLSYYDRVTKLEFHPLCKDLMRSTVLSKACLTTDPITPISDLHVSASQSAVVFAFSPPNNTGVLRYDIYRSYTSLDQAPALLASTTQAIWVDLSPIGMTQGVYYRVRVVTTSGQSGFSNESGTAYCVPTYPMGFPLGFPFIDFQQLTGMRVRTADLNDDGLPDAVVAGGSNIPGLSVPPGRLRLLYNTGSQNLQDETFVSGPLFATVAFPRQVVVDDFNDDGIADIAVLGGTEFNLYVHLGQGTNGVSSGTYASPVEYFPGADVTDMVSADVNEDGIRDLLVSGYAGFGVMLGNGSGGVGVGTFADPAGYGVPVGDYFGGITVLDANEDGILDVACTDQTLNRVYVFLGLGSGGVGNGTFSTTPLSASCGPAPTSIAHGDFNRDGIEDLVVAHSGAASVGVLLGNGSGGVGNGTFQNAVTYPTAYAPATVSVGDWFTDGNRDVLTAEPGPTPGDDIVTSQEVGFLLGNAQGGLADGTLTSSVRQTAADGPVDATSEDVNGDGIADVLSVGSRTPSMVLLYGNCHRVGSYSITVLSPDGGESDSVGSDVTLRWKHGNLIGPVNVEISRNGGVDWKRLATAVNDTTYVWRVVPPLSTTAQLRITDATVSTLKDVSNANFSIVAPGSQLLVPDGGASEVRIRSASLSSPGDRTMLRVQLTGPVRQEAWIDLFDVTGRRLARERLTPAQDVVEAQIGLVAKPGIYFVRFRGGAVTEARRLVLNR